MSPTFTVDGIVNYPDDTSDTPQYKNLTRKGLHQWLDKLLDTEPELTSFVMTVVKN